MLIGMNVSHLNNSISRTLVSDWLRSQGWCGHAEIGGAELKFAFWNTGLYPPSAPVRARNEVAGEALMKAKLAIDFMLDSEGVDILGLCEVSEDYALGLTESLLGRGYDVGSSVAQERNFIQDNLIIYRRSQFLLKEKQDILHAHYSGRLRVATKYLMQHVSGQEFYFYVCHWPSRKSRAEDGIGRDDLGYRLRAEIDTLGIGANVVVMGDFNDEPYNDGLADKLMASRDLSLVHKQPRFLYNPFWRRLGGVLSYSKGGDKDVAYGTYYWKESNGNTKWYTFDQLIFSSSFIVGGEWHLKESAARVHEEFCSYVLGSGASFDHLPVSATIERD